VQLTLNEFDEHGCKKPGDSGITMTRTQIAGRDYLEFSLGKEDRLPSDLVSIFFAYRIDSGSHLLFDLPNLESFQHAVEVGDIQGIITYPKNRDGKRIVANEGPDIHISDSTEHLRAYLAAHPDAMKESNDPGQPSKLDKIPNMDCKK
jgi:hypothetical protein